MSRGGVVMMVVVLTLVWGGFAASILMAMAHERRQGQAPDQEAPGKGKAAAEPAAGKHGGR